MLPKHEATQAIQLLTDTKENFRQELRNNLKDLLSLKTSF